MAGNSAGPPAGGGGESVRLASSPPPSGSTSVLPSQLPSIMHFLKKTNKPAFIFYGVHYATSGIEMYYFERIVSHGESSAASPMLL